MGPIDFLESSVSNYQRSLRNMPKERGPQLHSGGSLKSCRDDFDCVHAMTGRRGITPVILNHNARWRWVVSIALRPLFFRGGTLRQYIENWR